MKSKIQSVSIWRYVSWLRAAVFITLGCGWRWPVPLRAPCLSTYLHIILSCISISRYLCMSSLFIFISRYLHRSSKNLDNYRVSQKKLGSQKISICSNWLNFEAKINCNNIKPNVPKWRKTCTGLKFDLLNFYGPQSNIHTFWDPIFFWLTLYIL